MEEVCPGSLGMKARIIAAGLLMLGATAPLIPQEMKLQYSYQYRESQFVNYVSTTTGKIARPFTDDNEDDIISVAVFKNERGDIIEVQIPELRYKEVTERDGYRKNPTKDEYKSLLGAFTETAKAAIAVDSTSSSRNNSASSITFSHTNTGSNLILLCGIFTASTDNLTSVTYNSVGMTLAGKVQVSGDRWVYLHYLTAPATGANNVTINTSTTDIISATCASYTGVEQTTPFNQSSTNSQTSTTNYSHSLTTSDPTWTVFMVKDNLGGMSAGSAPTTMRILDAAGDKSGLYDSNSSVSSGSNTLNVTNSSGNFASVMVALQEPIVIAPLEPINIRGTGRIYIQDGNVNIR